ncbi:MAG: hypothetical protein M1546_11730, partial [Chloroflexi bacterium]|nr:hypothetical protein [Chloroflexota bacterium]
SIGIPQFTLVSESMSKWGDLTAKSEENRVKYVTGKLSEADWDAWVAEMTKSDVYQAVLKEFKASAGASQ